LINVAVERNRLHAWTSTLALALAVLAFAAPFARAQAPAKTCDSVEVRSIKVSPSLARDIPRNAQQETVQSAYPGRMTEVITAVARGPVLGCMDSENVQTDLTCSDDDLVLTATISRSANHNRAVPQNALWLPTIMFVIVPHRPEILFQTIWKMHRTDGTTVDHAGTPPYPDQKYPITRTKILRGKHS